MKKENFISSFWRNGKIFFVRRQTNILSAAVVLMAMILASGILGLLRDRLLAAFFFNRQDQWQLDIYFASFRLPDMLFQVLILSSLSAAFIPVFSEYLTKNEKEAYKLASSILNIGMLMFFFASLLVFIFVKPLSQLITHELSDNEVALMINLTRFLLLAQFFFLLSNFLTGVLQSYQRFLLPSLSAVLYNLGIILGIIFLTPIIGIYGPVTGVIIGSFLHFIVQLPVVKRLGFQYSFLFDFSNPGVKKIGKLMLPRTIAFAINQIDLNMVVFLGTALSAGSLSIYNFAQHLNALPISLFGLTIGQAALPTLAREAQINKDNFRRLFSSSLLQIFYLSLPVGIILLVLRVPLVRLVFGAKNFPWEATLTTARVVGIMSLFLGARSASQLMIRAFYALQDTVTPLILSIINIIVSVSLALWFIFGLHSDIVGLALAQGIGEFLFIILLFLILERKIRDLLVRKFVVDFGKIIFASFFTALSLWIPMRILDRYILDTTRTINLLILTIITLLIGVGTYLAFSLIFKISQLGNFLMILKRFGHWRKILSESEEVLDTSQVSSLPSETE